MSGDSLQSCVHPSVQNAPLAYVAFVSTVLRFMTAKAVSLLHGGDPGEFLRLFKVYH